MRRLLFAGAALLAALTAKAAEDNDTTVIDNARQVMVITGDSVQHIKVMGRENDDRYVYENSIQLVDTNYVSEQRTYHELKSLGWNVGKKNFDGWRTHTVTLHLGLGVSAPTQVPDAYELRPFKSWEAMLWALYNYTPRKKLQTYSAGLGFTFRNYGLRDNQMFAKDAAGVTELQAFPQGAAARSSYLNVVSLSVPFFFTQRFGAKSHFRLTVGPVVNFNMSGRLVNDYELGDQDFCVTTNKIGVRPVTVDLMAVLKAYGVGFYFKYSPMTVFKEGRGPQFHALSFGLYF